MLLMRLKSYRGLLRLLFVGLFALIATTLWGCNCEEVGAIGRVGEIAAEPPSLSFNAKEGESQTLEVKVIAKQGAVRVDAIDVIQGQTHFSIEKDSLPELPKDLEEGGSFTIKVTYKATQGAAPTGKIRVESSASVPNEGKLDIFLLTQTNEQLLRFRPDPVDFGSIERGGEKTLEAVGTNAGRADLVIQSIKADPSTSDAFTFPDGLPNTPLTLKPGDTLKIKVTYKPDTNKIDRGALLFNCENNCAPSSLDPTRRKDPFRLDLIGTVGTATIEVSPKVLDFGVIPSGQTKKERIKVTNKGKAPLKISKIGLKRLSSGAFVLPTLVDVEVGPGESKDVEVTYRPINGTEHKGAVQFESNDPTSPLVEVQLLGKVVAPKIKIAPPVLNFGKVPTTRVLDVTIANVGSVPLTVDPATFAPGSSQNFTFPVAPKQFTIQPNSSIKLSVAYTPTSTNPDNGKVLIPSNDPETPVAEVELIGLGQSPKVCDLVGQPARVRFGLGLIGKPLVKDIVLYNQGADECELKSLRATMVRPTFPPYIGPDVFTISAYPQGCTNGVCNPALIVKPGNTIKVRVAFSAIMEMPSLTGDPTFRGALNYQTNGTPADRKVDLEAVATNACVSVIPDTIDVGLVKTGCASRNEKITLYNNCPLDIEVSKIAFNGAANNFAIVSAPLTPFTLAAGKTADIEVKHQAVAPPSKKNAVLDIEHSFVQTSPISVTMTAQGTDKDEQTDTFKQPSGSEADVLFVIDNSCSMGNDQSSLSNNIKTFVQWATTLKADFHLGVTTTEIASGSGGTVPGELRGSPRYLTNNTPNLVTIFSQRAKVGTGGNGQEAGLEAARIALSAKMLNGINKGFLRKSASLSIMVFSDEPDQSPQPASFYVSYFKGLKGGPRTDQFRFHAVIGYEPSTKSNRCGGNGGNRTDEARSSGRYLAVVQATQGVVASICNTSWASVLKQVSILTFSQKKQFFLTRPADPKTIQVTINGKASLPGAGGWTYNASSNTIEFNNPPAPNSTIVVKYKAICF